MSDEEGRVDARPAIASRAQPACAADATDPVLQALARQDRDAAAASLMQLHAAAIGRVCMALLGSQGEAEDALQDTLLAALDGLEGFRGDGTLRAWLLSVARRRCARRLEARTREREARQSLVAPAAPPGAERSSMAARARRLLEELRPTQREALVLRFAAELSFREVGRVSGVDEATARKRASRGLSRLRSLLGEDEP